MWNPAFCGAVGDQIFDYPRREPAGGSVCAKILAVGKFSVAAVAQWIEYWPPKPKKLMGMRSDSFASRVATRSKSLISFN